MFFFRFVLSVLISSFVFLCSIESKSIPLIGLFTDDEINRNSSKLIIDYALNRFKALKHLRNNFVIQRDQNEIPCDMAIGTKFVFDMIHQTPRPLAIFSGSCQTVASAIAETAAIYDMTIMVYSETSSLFTARDKYPSLIRTVPGDSQHNIARKLLLKKYNWRRFGILYQYERQYTMPVNRLNDLLQGEPGWETALSKGISFSDLDETQGNRTRNSLYDSFEDLKKNNVRIILGNFNSSMATRVFCEAFRSNLFGPRFQWIIVGFYETDWWKKNQAPCEIDEILLALNGTLQTRVAQFSHHGNRRTIADLTADQFKFDVSQLKAKNYFLGYAFDALLTLTSAFENIRNCSTDFHLDEIWRQTCWREELLNRIQQTDIEGVTGRIRFHNGDRIGEIVVEQILVSPKKVEIVEIFVALPTNRSHFELSRTRNGRNITWHGFSAPIDQIKVIKRDQRISILTYTIIGTISVVGILLSIFFFIFNIIFRAHRFVRMSSPQINNLILAGSILCYISVLLMGIDSTLLGRESSESSMNFICAARVWTLSIGFTISFGAIFSKAWRVKKLFTMRNASKRAVKDSQLFLIVGILFLIDSALLLSWQFVDPLKIFKNISERQTKDEDVVIVWNYEECRCRRRPIWITMQSIYKGILMVIGSRFAWAIRNVRIVALNDSTYVGLSLYNVVLLSTSTAVVGFFLRDQHERSYILTSIFILICVTITLCLVFVPKLRQVAKDPRSRAKPERAVVSSLARKVSESRFLNEIHHLISENRILTSNVRQCDQLIGKLLEILNESNSKFQYEVFLRE